MEKTITHKIVQTTAEVTYTSGVRMNGGEMVRISTKQGVR